METNSKETWFRSLYLVLQKNNTVELTTLRNFETWEFFSTGVWLRLLTEGCRNYSLVSIPMQRLWLGHWVHKLVACQTKMNDCTHSSTDKKNFSNYQNTGKSFRKALIYCLFKVNIYNTMQLIYKVTAFNVIFAFIDGRKIRGVEDMAKITWSLTLAEKNWRVVFSQSTSHLYLMCKIVWFILQEQEQLFDCSEEQSDWYCNLMTWWYQK